ncbi:septum formation protein Maf [Tenacibaculum sp. SZ-18]|uniref:Maf-like protein n=1 Tax=Tenacibaculum sp. SZ-18 TaxID=754423 RepID=UPI000C2D61A6|nr:Maf-like protein [Tenacibaculum sp. SZ-18]AUC14873.1 septum formation protein Maf [Tenacibaculum sp. SZ-18]
MLKEKLAKFNIILASGSPRRQQFFKDLDLNFEIRIKSVDEIYPNHLEGSEITDYIADLKTVPFKDELNTNDLLVTSDTIVWLDNKALGKPKDYHEAFKMIESLSGKSHQVITSVSLKSKNFQKVFNDTATVYFRELTKEEIDYYIKMYQPYDKAGAYGIQEWIGKIGIHKIEGSYFNVMGLPVHKLYKELMNL